MAHIPVLLSEVLAAVQLCRDQLVIDATFGAGGYARAFLSSGARVIAFDRDPAAKVAAEKLARDFPGQFQFIHAPFSYMKEEIAQRNILPACAGMSGESFSPFLKREGYITQIDAIVFDLGVSSMQFDQAERGFSFRHDGPLDMRMSSEGASAADLVNTLGEKDLADLLFQYGEEKRSRAIAEAIVARRAEKPFTRTLELAQLIEKTIGRNPRSKIHPATRSFQALRIAVNQELEEISAGLNAASRLLKTGGRLAAVTFHSLEDRIVKKFLAQERAPSRHAPETCLTKPQWQAAKLITPGQQEIAANSRARSAKLRIAEKIDNSAI